MKKQYCMEWYTKKGNSGFKSLGHDLTEDECEKALMRKLKQKSTSSVQIDWNYVGDDVSKGEKYVDHFVMFGRKKTFEVFGTEVYVENDYQIERGELK